MLESWNGTEPSKTPVCDYLSHEAGVGRLYTKPFVNSRTPPSAALQMRRHVYHVLRRRFKFKCRPLLTFSRGYSSTPPLPSKAASHLFSALPTPLFF